jgi:hypothetical protein
VRSRNFSCILESAGTSEGWRTVKYIVREILPRRLPGHLLVADVLCWTAFHLALAWIGSSAPPSQHGNPLYRGLEQLLEEDKHLRPRHTTREIRFAIVRAAFT